MKIGYARVSTMEQSLDLQVRALKTAGCERTFQDRGFSGKNCERPGLRDALDALSEGDTLVVWRLDRLARSMRDLTDTIHALHKRGIAFHSISEMFDVGSAFGELVLHIIGAIAHFERALIIERTRAGMDAAKARGVRVGRPPAMDGEKLKEALYLLDCGANVSDAACQIGVGRSTLYKYLIEHRPLPISKCVKSQTEY